MRNAFTAIVLFFFCYNPVYAQVCSIPSLQSLSAKYNWKGIGDGCTVSYGGYLIDIAAFKDLFTPACNSHDKCFTTIGRTGWECNDAFYSEMRSACRSKYNPLLRPVEYSLCNDSALKYYTAVQAHVQSDDPTKGLQSAVLIEVRILNGQINADSCGITPEGSSFIAPSVISNVNNAFANSRGRLPTIYEFFSVLSTGDIIYNKDNWYSTVLPSAVASSPFTVPAAGFTTNTSGGIFASPNQAGVSYMWKLNGKTYQGPSAQFATQGIQTGTVNLSGFLRAQQGLTRNMAVIQKTVTVAGKCPLWPKMDCDLE